MRYDATSQDMGPAEPTEIAGAFGPMALVQAAWLDPVKERAGVLRAGRASEAGHRRRQMRPESTRDPRSRDPLCCSRRAPRAPSGHVPRQGRHPPTPCGIADGCVRTNWAAGNPAAWRCFSNLFYCASKCEPQPFEEHRSVKSCAQCLPCMPCTGLSSDRRPRCSVGKLFRFFGHSGVSCFCVSVSPSP